jgi:hypothetical protein
MLCGDCSMPRNPSRGFNIRRNPTYKNHSTDIDEIQKALVFYNLDKMSNHLSEWATDSLLDFYKRHGFTGIVELDEVVSVTPTEEEEQAEYYNALTPLKQFSIPWENLHEEVFMENLHEEVFMSLY